MSNTLSNGVIANVMNIDAYNAIIELMSKHGFKQYKDGSISRPSTRCAFSFECLNRYDSLMDFQVDWSYS